MSSIYRSTSIIDKNGRGTLGAISGKIIKVVVKTNKENPALNVIMKTSEGETLWFEPLKELTNVIYPRQVIPVSPETQYTEYYYTDLLISIEVQGLIENQIIREIKVYYEE